jgi:DNA replication licensing factor MCM3
MLKSNERRLVVNINDIRVANPEMANGLLQSPLEWLPPLETALKEVSMSLNDPAYNYDLSQVQLHVGLEGSFGALQTTPRHLSSSLLSHMVCLEGIVTSCSLVRPKLLRSVHYSDAKKAFMMREYWDATMLDGRGLVTSMNYPTTGNDAEGLTSEFGLCSYRDYQTVAMQEMPERAPAGQLPRSVDVVLEDDLVDVVKPGDRVHIVGVYKSLAGGATGGAVPSAFRTVLIALHVKAIGSETLTRTPSDDDLYNIRAVCKRRDLFGLLSRSLAPSIYGHEWVKKAVLLMLLGGVEKNLPNGTHLRGDINLMLVGDPSTAKSQMLRFVLGIAPLAIATTGRGSSGVGLTAAVTTDRETGERRLEAGAMVLADRGIVCIDEFDKMSDVDRVAIHEVMEQQTVTIAKAGIHASLNARCSVLAAANPIWGQYRETASPQENIRLPDSLLSRFDLLFIILDTADPEHDRRISSHVLRMHRHIPAGLAEGQPLNDAVHAGLGGADSDDETFGAGVAGSHATAVFQKHYGDSNNSTITNEDEDDEILTMPFLKKYIHHARTCVTPVLTKAATEHIVASYTEFRQKRDAEVNEAKTFPVTPRTLETLIRLATAHAKARLSLRVEKRDARVAQELLEYCLYKEVKKKTRKSKRTKAVDSSEESDSCSDGEESGEEVVVAGRDQTIPSHRNVKGAESANAMEGLSLEEASASLVGDGASSKVIPSTPVALRTSQPIDSRGKETDSLGKEPFVDPSQEPSYSAPTPEAARAIRAALHRLRSASTSAVFSTTTGELRNEIGREDPAMAASIGESSVLAVLEEMQRLNQVMFSDGTIYII